MAVREPYLSPFLLGLRELVLSLPFPTHCIIITAGDLGREGEREREYAQWQACGSDARTTLTANRDL